jgi:hypothetical protein
VLGRSKARAAAVLVDDVRRFGGLGYRPVRTIDPLEARVASDRHPDLRIALRPTGGRIFGGTFAMEVATAERVLPATARGVSARGRGVVRLRTIDFRARPDDGSAQRLAERLRGDRRLIDALSKVHFEEVRVDPDGRAVIRHMGGSLVWLLFPPMARPVPISPDQVAATVAALEAFVRAGARA